MVAVADVFDALTTERPYKPAWPLERTLTLLREQRGQHFWPDAVDALLDHLPQALEIQARWREHSDPGVASA